jgi:hypothetical protein
MAQRPPLARPKKTRRNPIFGTCVPEPDNLSELAQDCVINPLLNAPDDLALPKSSLFGRTSPAEPTLILIRNW